VFAIMIRSKSSVLTGYRFFWAMTVVGFNDNEHCQKCFVGQRLSVIRATTVPMNETIELMVQEGTVVYFCGVSESHVWAKNFHLAVRVTGDKNDRIVSSMVNGQTITIRGAGKIDFDERAAQQLYPEKSRKFLTCRNFQFAAQMFGVKKQRHAQPKLQGFFGWV